jgi:hypothetical protein
VRDVNSSYGNPKKKKLQLTTLKGNKLHCSTIIKKS